jgi:hypothetical protein
MVCSLSVWGEDTGVNFLYLSNFAARGKHDNDDRAVSLFLCLEDYLKNIFEC